MQRATANAQAPFFAFFATGGPWESKIGNIAAGTWAQSGRSPHAMAWPGLNRTKPFEAMPKQARIRRAVRN